MILDQYEFRSCFAGYIRRLITQKHDEGFLYDSAKYILIQFDKFCLQKEIINPIITKELASAWGAIRTTETRVTLGGRMSALRQLSLYMCSLGIDCYIPARFSSKSYNVAYVMNEEEIHAFFEEADSYIPGINADRFNCLALEYKILFRVIFCCGLRVSEARKLEIKDINSPEGRAVIRQSKGRKDRIVFIPDDLSVLCSGYLDLIQKKYGIHSELLFPSADPKKPLQVASINKKFHDFWNRTSFSSNHTKEPTVHSLRHSFVVIRMNKWMEQGIELNGIMPYLSNYLGHTSVDDTFYYYHQIESAFKIIRSKDSASAIIIPEVNRDKN